MKKLFFAIVMLLLIAALIALPFMSKGQGMIGEAGIISQHATAATLWTYDVAHSSGSGITFSAGNTVASFTNGSQNISIITDGTTTGKSTGLFHWEETMTAGGGATNLGVISGLSPGTYTGNLGNDANGFAYFSTSGGWYAQGVITFNSCGTTYWSVTNNVIAFEFNAATGSLKVYLGTTTGGSGSFVLQCTKTVTGGNYFPAISSIQTNVITLNTGQSSYYMTPTVGYGNL